MNNGDWADDDALLAALAEAVAAHDDVSDHRRTTARAAFAWRTVDEELAELLHDSAVDAGAGVRSLADAPRSLSFGRGGIGLDVDVDVEAAAVVGQVNATGTAADGPATVSLQRPDEPDRTVEADRSGFFRIPDVGPGPVRFVAARGGFTLTTPWVNL